MEKIVIFGSPSSGKSELARKMGEILMLNQDDIHNLDEYFWKPNWVRTELEYRELIIKNMILSNKWIIDGNFFNIVDKLLDAADFVVFLNISKYICYWRLLLKWISYLGTGIPEVVPGCKDRITIKYLKDIWLFPSTEGKIIREKAINKLGKNSVKIINKPQELWDFLNELQYKRLS